MRSTIELKRVRAPGVVRSLLEDLSARLLAMRAPTLLLWGGADAISPLRVGERLRTLLPEAALHYFPRGEHDLVRTHAEAVAGLIDMHLGLA